ncbi:protein transport protein SEC16B homolog [Dendrobium catenatum]|uniref:protein transport protein SEC16B homolog n=1 Tax=Dendrobium catenatum TaxID=906689 RepID=UPI00109FD4F8|nr:protein transport protein SEC16B homolog [Dendrobium catenatum]
MSSSSPPLQADQTDDEFFSKLVDSDYEAGQSHSNEEDMVRAMSNFSLGEVEDSGSASEVNGQKDNQCLSFSEATKNDASVGGQSEGLTEGAAIGAGASFKEIQWSAFNSQQFGLGDFESDLFMGSGFGSFVNSKEFSDSESTLIENTTENLSSHVDSYEQQYAQVYSSISEQSAGLTEVKNWENIYPDRKYETITRLCYQLDDNNATAPSQSDNFITTSANTHESSEVKSQNAFGGSVSERSDIVNLQQTSHTLLETISEESSVLKSGNQVSQDNQDYPPNMVFDPRYPEWYYDTITQMWYTLESYNHALHDASNSSQVPFNNNANALAKIQDAFEGSISEISTVVNLPKSSHPVIETISEEGCVLNSRNQFPPNMVFDPQYPEWYYDTITKKWYTIESYNYAIHNASNVIQDQLATNVSLDEAQHAFEGSLLETSDAVNVQQTSQQALETITEESSIFNSSKQVLQDSIYYPPNMVFDPQYPEWYYDKNTLMWYTLESYNHSLQDATDATQGLLTTNENSLAGLNIDDSHLSYGSHAQFGQYTMLERSSQKSHLNASESCFGKQSMWQEKNGQEGHLNTSGGGYGLTGLWQEQTIKESHSKASGSYDKQKMWQPKFLTKNGDVATSLNNQLMGSFYSSLEYTGSHSDKQLDPIHLEPMVKHKIGRSNMTVAQGYVTSESMHHVNQPNMEQSLQAYLSNNNYGTESSMHYTNQSFHGANPSYSQFSYNHNDGRSTAGRPPHALVTFVFGGRLLVMKDASFPSSSFVSGSQGTVGGVVSIHSLVDVVMTKADFWNTSAGCFGYFHTLCQESFPGPLVGGNAASKDINKWINDKISSSESSSSFFQNGLLLWLLLSLLKILCQHYGKLRSPYGAEPSHEGSNGPESAVSKLFASVKRKDTSFGGGYSLHCMKSPLPEGNIRATASEVQNLLVSGRRKEALQRAQEGRLWGTAVVLAAQLGEQFYMDTVKQMALQQFVCGSPLRTLYLLIAGQPADVFSSDSFSSGSSVTASGPYQSFEVIPNGLLDDWHENIAIIASNRTKDDELVIIHLGDCLWKERGEVAAAHACYLLAEVNFEPYSDSARLCLIGADHWKNTRTYACPDSIQVNRSHPFLSENCLHRSKVYLTTANGHHLHSSPPPLLGRPRHPRPFSSLLSARLQPLVTARRLSLPYITSADSC